MNLIEGLVLNHPHSHTGFNIKASIPGAFSYCSLLGSGTPETARAPHRLRQLFRLAPNRRVRALR